jgi:hypothetical protein
MRKGVSPFVASIILTSLSIVILGVLLIWGRGLISSLSAGVEKEKNLTLSFEAPRIVGIKGNEVFIVSDYPVPSEYTVRKFYLDTRELEILSKTSGDVIKLQLNETIPIGKQILRFITNTGRLWRQEFNVPSNWALSDFTERKGIVIDNTHSLPLNNYQIAVDPKLTITDGLVFHAHMGDEGNLVIDYSGNNNDGKLYGNTRALFKFDEGLDNKTYDSSSYANNGDFYGGNDGVFPSDATQINETFNCTALDTWLSLSHPEIISGSETVTNLTKSFTRDTDYSIDYANGKIKCLSTGSMVLNFLYNITYTYSRSPNWVDGKFGKALSFDGVDDYVRYLIQQA